MKIEKRKFGNKNEYLSVLGLGGIVIKGLDQYSSDSIVSVKYSTYLSPSYIDFL